MILPLGVPKLAGRRPARKIFKKNCINFEHFSKFSKNFLIFFEIFNKKKFFEKIWPADFWDPLPLIYYNNTWKDLAPSETKKNFGMYENFVSMYDF